MKIHKNKKKKFGFTSYWEHRIKLNMLNEFERLKNELSVLYPDVTDIELNEMTDNLIKFFTVGIKNIYKTKNIMTSVSISSEIPDDKSLMN